MATIDDISDILPSPHPGVRLSDMRLTGRQLAAELRRVARLYDVGAEDASVLELAAVRFEIGGCAVEPTESRVIDLD